MMSIGITTNRLNLVAYVFLLFMMFAIAALAGNNSGAAFSTWPDTGQTKCYNNTSEIPCPATVEAFYGQDAQYKGPTRSYTLLGGGTMVQDNVTGLIWEIKDSWDVIKNYSNPHDADNTYTWCDIDTATNGGNVGTCGANDTADFIGQLNSGDGFGGHSDWRMPTIKELLTLVDLGDRDLYAPTIDPIFATTPATALPYSYWSSTTYVALPYDAWRVDFRFGLVDIGNKFSPYYVRAVRGGHSPPEDRFVDNNDGTVTDTVTCLEWQKPTMDTKNGVGPDAYTWQEAMAVSETLNLAGHTDWRLPDKYELRSLVEHSSVNPYLSLAIDPIFATTTQSSYYWSSSTYHEDFPKDAWRVDFHSGYDRDGNKSDGYYVRAVRGGQCGGFGPLAVNVFPITAPQGTTFSQTGTGFTPNSSVTLHFNSPTGLITDTENTDGNGLYTHNWLCNQCSVGEYSYYAVDDTTNRQSNTVAFNVTELKTDSSALPAIYTLLLGRDDGATVLTVTSTTGQVWMDRNLGALRVATSPTDSEAYGDLYQWGRGRDSHEKRTSLTTSTLSPTDVPDPGSFILSSNAPYDWRSPQNNNLWQGVSGTNNPCSLGFRLPTETELQTEQASWSSNDLAGAFASPLKLVVAGARLPVGTLFIVGSGGAYWGSKVDGSDSYNLGFGSSYANVNHNSRAHGFSVRCIKD